MHCDKAAVSSLWCCLRECTGLLFNLCPDERCQMGSSGRRSCFLSRGNSLSIPKASQAEVWDIHPSCSTCVLIFLPFLHLQSLGSCTQNCHSWGSGFCVCKFFLLPVPIFHSSCCPSVYILMVEFHVVLHLLLMACGLFDYSALEISSSIVVCWTLETRGGSICMMVWPVSSCQVDSQLRVWLERGRCHLLLLLKWDFTVMWKISDMYWIACI